MFSLAPRTFLSVSDDRGGDDLGKLRLGNASDSVSSVTTHSPQLRRETRQCPESLNPYEPPQLSETDKGEPLDAVSEARLATMKWVRQQQAIGAGSVALVAGGIVTLAGVELMKGLVPYGQYGTTSVAGVAGMLGGWLLYRFLDGPLK